MLQQFNKGLIRIYPLSPRTWLKRLRYTRRMEDPKKVKAIKDKLNGSDGGGAWDDVIGLFTAPMLQYNPKSNDYTLMVDSGLTIKAFVNTDTGELRYYAFKHIEKTEDGTPGK